MKLAWLAERPKFLDATCCIALCEKSWLQSMLCIWRALADRSMASMVPSGCDFPFVFFLVKILVTSSSMNNKRQHATASLKSATKVYFFIWPLSYVWLIPETDHPGQPIKTSRYSNHISHLALINLIRTYQCILAHSNTDLLLFPLKTNTCTSICCCFYTIQIQHPCLCLA